MWRRTLTLALTGLDFGKHLVQVMNTVAAPADPHQRRGEEIEDRVPTALRQDLAISQQVFEGHAYTIVKDPLTLKYFRLGVEDFSLASLFDGRRTERQAEEAFVRLYPQAALAQDAQALRSRIQAFSQELATAGLLEATAAGVRHQLERQKQRQRSLSPWAWFMKGLFLKIPLWDPDRLLTRLERPLRPLWSWTGFALSLLVLLAGVAVFAFQFPRIAPSLNDFLTLPNLALVWALTLFVKVVHEFGHGLTCKHYGGEVHEMGAMLIVFSPFLYADVTDSYLFPKRRHRLLVAAAGIYIELLIAAVATLLWAVSQPGPAQQVLFNLMLITSVWTVLFNANPLLKFDGYYMLTDILAVPNLRAKAQMCVSDLFRRLIFGRATPPAVERLLPRRNRSWFVFYSIASQLYLLQVTLGIAMLFHYLLQPYGLAWLGDGIGAAALVSMLIVPVTGFFRKQFMTSPSYPGAWKRPAALLAGIVGSFGLLMLMPWQTKVERPALLRPFWKEEVRSEVAGQIKEIRVRDGQQVQAGEILAVLSSPKLEAEAERTRLMVERARSQMDMALGAGAPSVYQQAGAFLKEAEGSYQEAQRLVSLLVLRASRPGVVLTPDLQRLVSGSLRPGQVLCEIASMSPMEAFIPLNQREARYIRAGQEVELRTAAFPNHTFRSQVSTDLKTMPADELPPNLIATLGGDVAAQPDAEGRFRPLEVTYGVRVSLDNAEGVLRPGMTATVRIQGETLSLWRVWYQAILDFLSLDYRI